jgi:branched-chain amino acid transport system ATP-binding protein
MSPLPTAAALSLRGLSAGYGPTVIVEDVTLEMALGSCLAVLGRNGVGKSTLLRTIMGMTRVHAGRIAVGGRDLAAVPVYRRSRAGLGFVPQEREVFKALTVDENLECHGDLAKKTGAEKNAGTRRHVSFAL